MIDWLIDWLCCDQWTKDLDDDYYHLLHTTVIYLHFV